MVPKMKFHTDMINSLGAAGWAIDDDGSQVAVVALAEGQVIGSGVADGYRPDVFQAHAQMAGSKTAGFNIAFDPDRLRPGAPTLVKVMASAGGRQIQIGEDYVILPPASAPDAMPGSAGLASSYPKAIDALVRRAYPDANGSPEQFAEAVRRTLSLSDLRPLPAVSDYARFLTACWAHFRFVEQFFPHTNKLTENRSSKDFFCKVNSAEEMITIAHHLYVLKSYGISGAFAEFGCFKGFSSSMLSYACNLLGIEMHIYDSFEGLPESSSGYYRVGEFCGSLDEVKANVRQFGVIDGVKFHPGFFAESLATSPPPPLMTLWMDVDLYSSAQDVMAIASSIAPEGAIFSHECVPEAFQGPVPASVRSGPDEVVPAILGHFDEVKSEPAGRFVAGYTGAFWRRDQGIPVLGPQDIISSIEILSR
jgi:hypothetical protein